MLTEIKINKYNYKERNLRNYQAGIQFEQLNVLVLTLIQKTFKPMIKIHF